MCVCIYFFLFSFLKGYRLWLLGGFNGNVAEDKVQDDDFAKDEVEDDDVAEDEVEDDDVEEG
jgi:hypothetical protein